LVDLFKSFVGKFGDKNATRFVDQLN